jgi:hypothetical protein
MLIRYFDADKKGLDKRATSGAYFLECATEEELALSGNSANIKWDGNTPSLKSKEEREADELQRQIDEMTIIPKLEIRRAFRSINKEAELDALIASSPEMTADWNDAIMIDLSDELVIAALDGSGIEVDSIKEAILAIAPTNFMG